MVCFHFASAFLPSLIPDQTDHPYWVADTPLGILFNGAFSVSIFFVLSGFVIAQAAAKRRDPIYISIPLRYLRLALPATASVVFAWCLLTLMPVAALQLNALIPHPWLNWTHQQPIPNLVSAFYNGSIGIFVFGGSQFNNVLWTMKIEAIGSMCIYALYGLRDGRTRAIITFLIGFVTLLKPAYFGFVLGMLMSDLWSAGKLRGFSPLLAFSAGVLLGAPAHGFAERLGLPEMPDLLTLGASNGLFPPVAAALIVYAALNSTVLEEALSSHIPQYLGRVSFPLYLVHVPLLYTIFASQYVSIQPKSSVGILSLFAAFLLTSLVLASAGEVWIDGPVLNYISLVRTKLRYLRASARTAG